MYPGFFCCSIVNYIQTYLRGTDNQKTQEKHLPGTLKTKSKSYKIFNEWGLINEWGVIQFAHAHTRQYLFTRAVVTRAKLYMTG